MKFRHGIIPLLVIIWLVTAAGGLMAFRKAKLYYQGLNALRLDPLELRKIPAARVAEPVLVFYGDSRMAQWPQPPWLGEPVVNLGISGQTTRQILDRFDAHLAPLRPKVVVIQAGMNDLKTIALFPHDEERIIAECGANLQRMVARSRGLGARVVITTLFPLGKLPPQRRLVWSDRVDPAVARINHMIMTMASDDVIVMDASETLDDGGGRMIPAYSRDFLHLTPEGYQRLNAELRRSVEPFIAR